MTSQEFRLLSETWCSAKVKKPNNLTCQLQSKKISSPSVIQKDFFFCNSKIVNDDKVTRQSSFSNDDNDNDQFGINGDDDEPEEKGFGVLPDGHARVYCTISRAILSDAPRTTMKEDDFESSKIVLICLHGQRHVLE